MTDPALLSRRLAFRRSLARAAILFEQIWPILWPPLGVAGVFVVAALLNLPGLLPWWLHIAFLLAVGAAIATLLVLGLTRVRSPDPDAVDRRLERSSGLTHRPLAALTDTPAQQDPFGQALWQAHLTRAAAAIQRLRVGPPRPGLARRDRKALRYAVLIAVVASLGIAHVDSPARLWAAVTPELPRPAVAAQPELRVWVTPPAYTRLPPRFLTPTEPTVSVPAGSHLTANLTGGTTVPTLTMGNAAPEAFRTLDPTSFQADLDLTNGGRLTLRRDNRDIAGWTIDAIPDRPPTAAWGSRPERGTAGQQTRLPWQVSDDYGVVALNAELRLEARPDAPPLSVTIPIPGGTQKSAQGLSQQDLTAHPWAGLKVVGRLIAQDILKQTGTSDDTVLTLPERPFTNPIARTLIEMRKGLSLHPDDRDDVLAGLDALLLRPQDFAGDYSGWLNLSALYSLMVRDKTDTMIAQAQSRRWDLALHLEEGRAEQTARALEAARQAAREALDEATREPNEANRQALEERLKELREAIDRHVQAMIEEAQRNGQLTPNEQKQQQLTNRDLDRMADRAREAAREGRMDDARKRMAELERMLDQLRSAKPKTGEDKQANAQRRQRGRQQMSAVQDLIGREAGLLDHAESRADQEPKGTLPKTTPKDPRAERDADRRVQQALRRALGELMQQFGDLTGEVPPGLTEADQAMRDAAQQLNAGRDRQAGEAQQQAIAALQKGAKEMGQAMAQAMARQQGKGQGGENGEPEQGEGEGEGDGDGDGNMMGMGRPGGGSDRFGQGTQPGGPPERADPSGRDPLGRRLGQGSSGADESNEDAVPEERERLRAQAIQEELRRRGAERERSRQELDYIDRLLKQF